MNSRKRESEGDHGAHHAADFRSVLASLAPIARTSRQERIQASEQPRFAPGPLHPPRQSRQLGALSMRSASMSDAPIRRAPHSPEQYTHAPPSHYSSPFGIFIDDTGHADVRARAAFPSPMVQHRGYPIPMAGAAGAPITISDDSSDPSTPGNASPILDNRRLSSPGEESYTVAGSTSSSSSDESDSSSDVGSHTLSPGRASSECLSTSPSASEAIIFPHIQATRQPNPTSTSLGALDPFGASMFLDIFDEALGVPGPRKPHFGSTRQLNPAGNPRSAFKLSGARHSLGVSGAISESLDRTKGGQSRPYKNDLASAFEFVHKKALPPLMTHTAFSDDDLEEFGDPKNYFTDLIEKMMYVSGETGEPSAETTGIIEEIVRLQVVEMVSKPS